MDAYSPAFLRAMQFVLPHEEEFARGHWGDEAYVVPEHVPGDPGGETKYGIDAASHPGVEIDALTREDAVAIYHQEWLAHGLDRLPDKLAIACFDVWVNGGHAWLWLQHALNQTSAGNTQPSSPGAATPEPLAEDGDLGPATLSAVATCDQTAVLRLFLQQRDARFRALAERPSMAKFLSGWLQRDADLAAFLSQ